MGKYDALLNPSEPMAPTGKYDLALTPQDIPQASAPMASQPRADIQPRQQASAMGALGNVPDSAVQYGKDMTMPIRDPKGFVKGIKQLFTKEGIEAMGDFYKERYGGVEEAMKTAYEDPVGFMSDVSIVGAPLRIAGMAGRLGKEGGLLNKVGGAVEKAGAAVDALDPINAAGKVARGGSAQLPGVKDFPEETYKTNLKMSLSPTNRYSQPKVRDRVVNTLLENDVPITQGGVNKMRDLIDVSSAQLDTLVKQAEEAGTKIPMRHVLSNLMELRREVGNPITNPTATADKAAVTKYMQDWLRQMGPVREIGPADLRALRQGLDNKLNWNNMPVTTEPMQKQIVEEASHGARNALKESVEGVGGASADVHQLLEAAEPLQRAANRLDNNNQIPLRGAIGGAAGAATAITGDSMVEKLAGLVMAGASAAWTPNVKDKVARYIYRNREKIPEDVTRSLISQLMLQTPQVVSNLEDGQQNGQ